MGSKMVVHLTVALMLLMMFSLKQVECLAFRMGTDSTRRTFFTRSTVGALGFVGSSILGLPQTAVSAPEIFNTPSGIKYAILKQPTSKAASPANGDFVAIEYTGYLTNGQIWDSTHAEGKGNSLLFQLGTNVVNDGVNEMISNMSVGQKVQAIIPAKLAFGEKGLCLENGECLIKPGEPLVYDIALKKTAIPPP
mmetsp:Transcript_19736/g.29299  ORF Transcript_19736/g.29299 Transcript_19736/m.29299 type:complete len:194 (-) Transcript_19736:2375-2956(-)